MMGRVEGRVEERVEERVEGWVDGRVEGRQGDGERSTEYRVQSTEGEAG